MASESQYSVETLKAIILELHDQVESLTKENTDQLESIKKLKEENTVLRQNYSVLRAMSQHIHNVEVSLGRVMGAIEDPKATRAHVIESIIKSHEKKLSIDSAALPIPGKPCVTTTQGFAS